MKKLVLSTLVAVMTMLGLGGFAVLNTADCMAANDKGKAEEIGSQYVNQVRGSNNNDLMGTVKVGINVLLGVIGTIAVVMIIVGGINYTTSQGDAGKVKKARDTILYGVIGLVVALLAFAIVNFVLTSVFEG